MKTKFGLNPKEYKSARKALGSLFAKEELSEQKISELEDIYKRCEMAWKKNLVRLRGKKIRYLLIAEAVPCTGKYFYKDLHGQWSRRVLNAFHIPNTESVESRFKLLAEKGFLLVDTIPFAMKYTNRRSPEYFELVKACKSYLDKKLSDKRLSWSPKIRVAIAFKLHGMSLIEAYPKRHKIPKIKLSEKLIATDGSNYTSPSRLREIYGI